MVMLGTDMKVAETPKEGLKDYVKTDPYEEWLRQEGVKIYREFYFSSLAKVELGPWERKGGMGAVAHIDNRHMPNDCHIVEIKPGGRWILRGDPIEGLHALRHGIEEPGRQSSDTLTP